MYEPKQPNIYFDEQDAAGIFRCCVGSMAIVADTNSNIIIVIIIII